jgi:hypothetical protein
MWLFIRGRQNGCWIEQAARPKHLVVAGGSGYDPLVQRRRASLEIIEYDGERGIIFEGSRAVAGEWIRCDDEHVHTAKVSFMLLITARKRKMRMLELVPGDLGESYERWAESRSGTIALRKGTNGQTVPALWIPRCRHWASVNRDLV